MAADVLDPVVAAVREAVPELEISCSTHAEIDLGRIVEGKLDFDAVGHYSRPDIFRFEVDERQLS